MYISPRRLKSGSRVAIVAPSSPFKSDELLESIDVIREMGLEPVLGPNVKMLRSDGIHAASAIDRADELMWAFSDPTIGCVIAATGGNGAAETLPYLRYDTIAKSRKPFVGMSDCTALHCGIQSKSGLITFNGQSPNIRIDEGTKVNEEDTLSFKLMFEMLMSDQTWGVRSWDINTFVPRTVSPGRASGFVVGGNCDTFVHLLGTPYLPNCDGAILFIEDTGKDGGVLSRQFIHLRLAGILDNVAGVVIGQFFDVPKRLEERTPTIEDVVQEYFSDGPPCVYGFTFSHGNLTSTIPIGAKCDIDADAGVVSFDFRMA